jgi:hypothetical protein
VNTAIQLRLGRDPAPNAELLHGTPREVVAGRLGPVALFPAGEVVAYLLRYQRRPRLFVFRTLVVDDPLAAAVPGVRPRVQLLLELRSAGRVRLARNFLSYLLQTGRTPSTLPDLVYLRIGVALAGRLPSHKVLLSYLPSPTAPV